MNLVTPGKFVAIEGPEGAGKTTIVRRLGTEAREKGIKLEVTREPGGTVIADELRSLIFKYAKEADVVTEFLMFAAARANHLSQVVIPETRNGYHVITDRFDMSTFAYQVVGRNRPDLKELFFACRRFWQSIGGLPCAYIYLDVPPEVGLERLKERAGNNAFDGFDLEFHKRVRDGYHILKTNHFNNVIEVDATGSEDVVYQRVKTVLNGVLA